MKKLTQYGIVAFAILSLAACKETPSETGSNPAATSDVVTTAPSNTKCYFLALDRDTTTVSLTIDGDKVTGRMEWLPYEKDGAYGTLSGTKNANGELELIYNYTIEGSEQSETKVMKIEGDKLMIKNGELVDPKYDGNLQYKDVSKATYSETLIAIPCD